MKDMEVTIGFCPRERFSKAPESLQSIVFNTSVPYQLVIVDCNTPNKVWKKMEPIINQVENVKVIRSEKYLLPPACKNLIVENATTKYVCLIENDVVVESGWLDNFRSAIDRHSADVVVPLIYEIFDGNPSIPKRPHFDDGLGKIREENSETDGNLFIEPRDTSRFDDLFLPPRRVEFMEAHCLFFRRDFLQKLPAFDEKCNASDDVEISMAVRDAGGIAVMDPSCQVTFVQPAFPVSCEDLGYFKMRWNPDKAELSHHRLMNRWKLAERPQMLGFWYERYARGTGELGIWRDEIRSKSEERPVVLVDGGEFITSEFVEDLNVIPFTERSGVYWGDPADDWHAIEELKKDINAGATMIVFTWNTFWYFSHYSEFSAFLRDSFPCVIEDERMVAFDLKHFAT